jgi:hypothetical protein
VARCWLRFCGPCGSAARATKKTRRRLRVGTCGAIVGDCVFVHVVQVCMRACVHVVHVRMLCMCACVHVCMCMCQCVYVCRCVAV